MIINELEINYSIVATIDFVDKWCWLKYQWTLEGLIEICSAGYSIFTNEIGEWWYLRILMWYNWLPLCHVSIADGYFKILDVVW